MTDARSSGFASRVIHFEFGWLPLTAILSLLAVFVLAVFAIRLQPATTADVDPQQELRIYCAAAVAQPIEELVAAYNQEYGAKVTVARIGGSGELLGQLVAERAAGVRPSADLLISADDWLLDQANLRGDIAERILLAGQRPVIAVSATSQAEIANIKDLVAQGRWRFGIASGRAAIGRITRSIAQRDNCLAELEARATTESENVMVLAQALATGSLDAAILWDTTVLLINQNEGAEVLRVVAPADRSGEFFGRVAIGVARQTPAPAAALRLARYLSAPEICQSTFSALGFEPVQGDRWAEVPTIRIQVARLLAPVMDEVLSEFAGREGVNLIVESGPLHSSLVDPPNQGERQLPDVRLVSDVSLLNGHEGRFDPPMPICQTDVVLVVAESVGAEVRTIADVADSELRVAMSDPQLSDLGRFTEQLLKQAPCELLLQRQGQPLLVSGEGSATLARRVSSGDFEAAFVYRSDVRSNSGLRVLPSSGDAQHAAVTLVWAVSLDSEYQTLLGRLAESLRSPQVRQRLEAAGFVPIQNPRESQ